MSNFFKNMLGYPQNRDKLGSDEPMKMRLLGGQWTTNFRHKGEKIQVGLGIHGTDENNPPNAAHIELGKVMADLEKGISPGGARKKIIKIKFQPPVKERYQQILDKWIHPFFGEYRPKDITEKVIEDYLVQRWGRSEDGQLQAVENTWAKELYVLNKLIRVVIKDYSAPKVKYIKLEKEILPPLTMAQIEEVSKFVVKKYRNIFWVMTYTAMDISDALDLKPEQIEDGMIIRPRGKTGEEICVPICPRLGDILKGVPRPLSKSAPFFPGHCAKNISTNIRNAFKRAGLEGYGAKYLRRYVASALLDAGYAMDWVAKALAHADKSPMTKKYTGIYKSTLKEAFSKLG